jgi:hypothetical protein
MAVRNLTCGVLDGAWGELALAICGQAASPRNSTLGTSTENLPLSLDSIITSLHLVTASPRSSEVLIDEVHLLVCMTAQRD